MNINFFMNKALDQANLALLLSEVPIGAVLVDNDTNKIITSAHNSMNYHKNSIAHAEMLIINDACKKINSRYLENTSIFITLEPCAMCAAAISEVRIKRLYFGAYDEKKGSLESIMNIYKKKNYFIPEVYGGISEDNSSKILKNFFQSKRNQKNKFDKNNK